MQKRMRRPMRRDCSTRFGMPSGVGTTACVPSRVTSTGSSASVARPDRARQTPRPNADGSQHCRGPASSRPDIEPLQQHLVRARALHERDLASGRGDVELPDALARKYPKAPYEWGWKFVFPSHKLSSDPRTGVIRRHHVYENYLIRGVKEAARPDRAGTAGPRQRRDDDDLHACHEQGRARRHQPAGRIAGAPGLTRPATPAGVARGGRRGLQAAS